jgi:putative ABC transport system permease protein
LSFEIREALLIGPFLQDLRYGARMLWKSPVVSLVAVVALALGIGANTAIFSVVNTVLLKPLPFEGADRLVMVWDTHPLGRKLGYDYVPSSNGSFEDFRQQSESFEQMAALDFWTVNLTGRNEPERIEGTSVSTSLFPLLRVRPMLGRAFTPEEERQGAAHVVLMSHGLWQRRFGGDANVVGQTVTLDGEQYEVVGVMPPDFTFPQNSGLPAFFSFAQKTDLWTPRVLAEEERRNHQSHHIAIIGRLKPGRTLEQAQAELSTIARRLEQQYPDELEDFGVSVLPLHEQVIGKSRVAILVLLCVVGFVLLIACANVANLLLARAAARQKEVAIRTALGASRLRVIRQLLTESVLLAFIGGACGVLLAMWGVDLLVALSPGDIPRTGEIGIDSRVLAFTFGVSLLTGLAFGLAPALQASSSDLHEALKEGGRGGTTGPRRARVRNVLIVSEVALALVLLAGAGLLVRSFFKLRNVGPGYDPENVLTLDVPLPGTRYKEGAQTAAFYQRLIERVKALPGVEAVGAVSHLPLTGAEELDGFEIEGRPGPESGENVQSADFRVVSTDYFSAMKIPLVRGRYFTEQDTADAPGVIIIDETLARRFFSDEDPIGKRMNEAGSPTPRGYLTVVGVVGGVKHSSLDAEPKPAMYVSYLQSPWLDMTLTVRTSGAPAENLAGAVRQEVWALDKDQPVARVATMKSLFARAVAPQRFQMLLVGLFAAVALLLSVVGIYGVMAYSVTQRTHEIGIRMALGAQRRDVFKLLMGQGMTQAFIGILLGLAGAFALTRLMSSLLYGVSATDPLTFAGVSLLLAAVALLACYVPARRAMRVDPMVALRYE